MISDPARGIFFGNREGRIHDPATKTLCRRRWASKQWICCALVFKNRHRAVWGKSYTEIFFLDEITALAAGHRPCFECRRVDASAFQAAVARGLGLRTAPRFPAIDAQLHRERLNRREKRLHSLLVDTLPDGAVVAIGATAFAIHGRDMLPWSPLGYGPPQARAGGPVTVLTPLLTIAALRSGYSPLWHPTASTRRPA